MKVSIKTISNKICHKAICFLSLIFLSVGLKAQTKSTVLKFDENKKNDLTISLKNGDEWDIETTGKDSWILTQPLLKPLHKEATVLSFEYFCPKGLDAFQIFFGTPITEGNSKILKNVGRSESWLGYTADLGRELKNWGKVGDQLRIDFGTRSNVQIQIRNIVLRPMTAREKEVAAKRDEKLKAEAAMESRLKDYLGKAYPSSISNIKVTQNEIIVTGRASATNDVFLGEITPYQDVTEEKQFKDAVPVTSANFEIKLKRYVKKEGINYDRLLSKWVIIQKLNKGVELLSHAHFPDEINAINNLPKEVAKGRKGIGGFSVNRGYNSDLDELDITSATVNIWFSKFMFSKPAPGRIEHVYNGKSYYFREKDVAQFDATFKLTASKGIVTAGILLVDKAEKCPDPEIGRLLQHPDMDPAGIYSMPNMTTPESVDCYAAALDFLAQRYSRPDKKYGRMNHWIMHNEVDAGWEWTNMGEKTASIFMDTYIKSMRMCYAIARQYNPHAEVFITLTHYWAWTSHPRFYPSKDLMEILINYSKVEGDFEWAMAHHPYPQSLREPKTWLDKQVDFTFNSQLITFKNLEVLDAWIKLPEVLYQGKTKRTLWLSENGTNSKTYSEQDLKEQAAGFAYTWKKMKKLDGIDGFQWHNWIDNRNEGGLRIGLRRFPDDKAKPGGVKPVWYVFKAADTKDENKVFDVYKSVIGIEDWDEVSYKGAIK